MVFYWINPVILLVVNGIIVIMLLVDIGISLITLLADYWTKMYNWLGIVTSKPCNLKVSNGGRIRHDIDNEWTTHICRLGR